MVITPELSLSAKEYSLLTDLYQLTMIACYTGENIQEKCASFELFLRHLPKNHGYLIAMGLDQALEYLEKLQFTPEQLRALAETGIFAQAPTAFWSLLESGRFTGDVWAVPEGTAIFPYEPILRVEAPLWQAQLVETYLLNTINYQTMIATKAVKMRDMAGEKAKILEFGSRRAFSPQAALWAARAALAAGFDSTSNVLAALKLGEKPTGTMAHALVMAIGAIAGSETEAFMAFNRYFPQAPLLIDTYDSVAAAETLAQMISKGQIKVTGVRLDSGDIAALAREIRQLLPEVQIFASGDLDAEKIYELQEQGANLDGYGIGTKLVTGEPVNGVYKLVEIEGIPTYKKSTGKASYPGRKQIWRSFSQGKIKSDRLGLVTQKAMPGEKPLLELVMQKGKRLIARESISTIKNRSLASLASLPPSSRQLKDASTIPVEISAELADLSQ